jgi:hypothetical protein
MCRFKCRLSSLLVTILLRVRSGYATRCAGGYYIGRISSQADFPGAILISLLGYFFACYYFLQVRHGCASCIYIRKVYCESCKLVVLCLAGSS